MTAVLEPSRRRGEGRVPPHNVEAEESLLGAMLLNRGAIESAIVAEVRSGDFYKPALGKIYEAVLRLFDQEEPVDPVTVSDELRRVDLLETLGGRQALLRLQGCVPASANASHYARIVAETSTLRRLIAAAGDIAELGYDDSVETADTLATAARMIDDLRTPIDELETFDLDDLAEIADADDEDPRKPWLIPGLFRLLETAIVTGGEGWGKMTLLRQIAVCVASGIHPFTTLTSGMPAPQRTLIVDLQEDQIDLAHELRVLRTRAGDNYTKGMLRAVSRPQGMNLLASRDARWLEAIIADHRPALVVMGPIVRMFRGTERHSRVSEDIVDELTDLLDRLRIRYGFALMLEGHAGNDRESADAWRVRGSSVWRSWPAFGIGMAPVRSDPREVKLVMWRGPRHAGRPWPERLYGGKPWPWTLNDVDFEKICKSVGLEELVAQPSLYAEEEPF